MRRTHTVPRSSASLLLFALGAALPALAQFPPPTALRAQTMLWIEAGKAKATDALDARIVAGLERTPRDYPLIITTTFRFRDATRKQLAAYHDLDQVYESLKFQDALFNPATSSFDKLTRMDDAVIWGRYCDMLVTLAREQQARGIATPLVLVDLEWLTTNRAGLPKFASFYAHLRRLSTALPAGTTLLLYPTGPGVVGRENFTPLIVRTWLGLPQTVLLDHDWRQREWTRRELPPVGTAGSLKADSLAHYYNLRYNRPAWGLCYTLQGCAETTPGQFAWCWAPGQWAEAVQASAAAGAPWSVLYPGADNYARQAAELFPDYVGQMVEVERDSGTKGLRD